MSSRTYNDACAAAHAMDLLGERWALLVVRELITGPKRFTDIRAGLPGLSANVLTVRLASLEAAGVVVRQDLPPPAAGRVYALTEWGREVEPIIQALGRWGARSPAHDVSAAFSTASMVLSFRTMFDPMRAAGQEGRIAFTTGRERHLAVVGPNGMEITPSEASADLEFIGDPRAIVAVIYGGMPPEPMEADGTLSIRGARTLIPWFAGLFRLPPKAPSADALSAQRKTRP